MVIVLMAAVLKYIMTDVLNLADNAANDNMYMMIISRHIQSIILAIAGRWSLNVSNVSAGDWTISDSLSEIVMMFLFGKVLNAKSTDVDLDAMDGKLSSDCTRVNISWSEVLCECEGTSL